MATERSSTSTIPTGEPVAAEPLGHVASLDGLRALAVAAVLAFHGDISGVGGGFLGVSVFFTLSGFLITALLLRQWTEHSRIDLAAFWPRRFRRLLPASWLTMGLVLVMGALGIWDTEQLRSLRGDVPWSMAELVNWHFIAQGTSYGDTFTAPSPLEHFWSLAIEQQFYVVLPLLVALVLTRVRLPAARRIVLLAAVLGALALCSAIANGVLGARSVDRAYFGTDTRAAELLVGALLAVATLRRLRIDSLRWRRLAIAGGAAALAVLMWLFHVAEVASPWLYPWGLLLTAACTAALIFGTVQSGALDRVFSWTPLPGIGAISYGVYLLHFPVFLWLTPARTGWSNGPLFGLRLAVTFAAALVMYRLLENPVRHGRMVPTTAVRWALPLAAVALVASLLAVTRDLPPPPDFLQPRDPDEIEIREAPSTTTTSTTTTTTTVPPEQSEPPPPPTEPPPPPRPPTRVLLVGDSVAASLEDALGDALNARGIAFATAAAPGCGVVTGDPADADGNVLEITAACNAAIPPRQREAVARFNPDLVVVMSTWEAGDRIVDGVWYEMGSPAGNATLRSLFDQTFERLGVGGAGITLATIPDAVDGEIRPANPETIRRTRLLNDVLVDIATNHPGRVGLLPMASIVCPSTPCPTQVDGITLRPLDGAHFDAPEGAAFVAARLADQIAATDLDRL